MKALSYLKEVRNELTKVTWPKRQEVVRLTLVVFVFSAIVAGYLGALDYVFTKALEQFLQR